VTSVSCTLHSKEHSAPESLRIKQVEEQCFALRNAVICSFNQLLPGFERAALDILHHHENYDGKGYPAGLKETEIPVVSRIVTVIDAFDAMVSSRPYRAGLPPEEAVRRLVESSGTQFDPAVVQCFLSFAQAEMAMVFAAAGTSVASAL
jgi:response regulator RpfG family c-di-GMP phosphodiesterase